MRVVREKRAHADYIVKTNSCWFFHFGTGGATRKHNNVKNKATQRFKNHSNSGAAGTPKTAPRGAKSAPRRPQEASRDQEPAGAGLTRHEPLAFFP